MPITRHTTLILAGLTAMILTLTPLGWAQADEETDDECPGAHCDDAGGGPMGHMGHMEGMSSMHGEGGGYGGMSARMSAENLKQRLGLTDDQTAKLKELRRNYLKETTMQSARVRVAELELADLLDEKKLDASKIEKKVKEIESLKSELMMGRLRSLIKSADFLTPEQFTQFRAMTMQRMGAGGMGQMGRMPQQHPMGSSGMGPHGGSGMTPGQMPGQAPGQMPGMMGPHQ